MKPREPRKQVIIPARMRLDGTWGDVCIRNISSRGMLLQSANPPPRGTYVEIFKGHHVIVGRVQWQKDRRFGIHTRERIEVGNFVEDSSIKPPDGRPPAERRRNPARGADEIAERSRRFSAVFQFGCVVTCGLAAAYLTVTTIHETLAKPLKAISAKLDPIE